MPANGPEDRGIRVHDHRRTVQPLPRGVRIGGRVRVRGRVWTLRAYEPHQDCGTLHLDTPGRVADRVLLFPFDRPLAEAGEPRWVHLHPHRWVRRVAAFTRHTLTWPHLLARPAAAAVLAYQLSPALAVADGENRVILADEVGLGKTAQAGWIIADLLARRTDARVIAAVPAGLRLQWVQELSSLFGIAAHAADASWLLQRVSDLPADVNPWEPPGVYVVSLDFLKRPDLTSSLSQRVWDLLVVDEAHTATAPTNRHAALEVIAARARQVVLITATPFSGDETGYSSLLTLGRPAGSPPPLLFRRSRADVGDARRRRHRFTRVALTAAERQFQRALDGYCAAVWKAALSADSRLAAIVLRKRALSSPAAAARSLRRRLRLLATGPAPPAQLSLFGDEFEEGDEEPSILLAAPGLADAGRERRWLDRLITAADQAAGAPSKARALARLLRRTGRESAIVFTEFRDTLHELATAHPGALLLHGGMTARERTSIQAHFNREGGLLLATDAAAEGLNLHGRCRLVINFELPWNPARLEQRIGRVDRIGQRRAVHALTLVAADTAEDLVVARFVQRLERVARTLGAKDRLAAFLTDARTAGMVLGGEPQPVPIAVPDVLRGESVPAASMDEAERLTYACSRSREDTAVLVSSVGRLRGHHAGVVVVCEWQLREVHGPSIASEFFALHLPPPGPPERHHLLGEVRSWIAAHSKVIIAAVLRQAGSSYARCVEAHTAAIERAMAREAEIEATAPDALPLQPGLFDRRAERTAALLEHSRAGIALDTATATDSMKAALAVQQLVHVKGVLVVSGDAP